MTKYNHYKCDENEIPKKGNHM